MTKRRIEYQPPERPFRFGEPPPKRRQSGRKPLSGRPTPALSYELGLVPDNSAEMTTETPVKRRDWETYILDRGTGTQEKIEGRSYTIGEDHLPVDVYVFPPDKPEGLRVGTVKMARIIALKPPREPNKKDDSLDKLNKRWIDIVVLRGVSKRQTEEPVLFNNGLGESMFVQAQWRDIRRKP